MGTGKEYMDHASSFNKFMKEFDETAQHLNFSINGITIAIDQVTGTVNDGAEGIFSISDKSIDIVNKMKEIKNRTKCYFSPIFSPSNTQVSKPNCV